MAQPERPLGKAIDREQMEQTAGCMGEEVKWRYVFLLSIDGTSDELQIFTVVNYTLWF